MTVIGHENLKALFPNFKKDIAENGIDLRIGKIEAIVNEKKMIGAVNDTKLPPSYHEIKPKNNEYYELLPKNFYFMTIDREIKIPDGYCQIYKLRSTFSRCGLLLLSSVGDNGFQGYLRMGLYNCSPLPISIGTNERIVQAVTLENDGSAKKYDGSYQNDKIYKKRVMEK